MDTKTTQIGAFMSELQTYPVFGGGHFESAILAGNLRATSWFPVFFNSSCSNTPMCKFSCFYPEVHHTYALKCYISAPVTNDTKVTKLC